MSLHLNLASALSDPRESIAWLISNGQHSAAYCYKLGPNGVTAECLCPQKAATIFQHAHTTIHRHNRLSLTTATNRQGYEDPCDACINAGWFPPFLPG